MVTNITEHKTNTSPGFSLQHIKSTKEAEEKCHSVDTAFFFFLQIPKAAVWYCVVCHHYPITSNDRMYKEQHKTNCLN